MKLAIMQPYFFPYIGYWQLISQCDEFIFFDVVQYNKKSWMNRNRVLHPDKTKEFQYISVPIANHPQGTLIGAVFVNNTEKWQEKILEQLKVYKKLKAPFYDETLDLIKIILSNDSDCFSKLAIESTKIICDYLDINLKYKIASDINFNREQVEEPGDWALEISKKLKATHYINPPGGYEIFDENKYNLNGVDLKFLKSNLTPYKQSRRENFQAGLSIIDVLMFNNKNDVKKILFYDFEIMTKKELMGIHEH